MKKKGMSQALTIVVAAVLLIFVSLVVITIVTGVVGKWGGEQNRQVIDTSNKQAISIATGYCRTQCLLGSKDIKTNIRIQGMDGEITNTEVTCNADKTLGSDYTYTSPKECSDETAG